MEASEIFEGREARKRKMGEGEPGPPGGGKVGRNSAGGASLLSPPLHPSLYPAPAHQQPEGLPSPDQGGGGHQEDEWKNIQVKLFSLKKHRKNCECCPFHSLFKGHYE